MAELPTGTVTFLFTDVEGSTRLLLEGRDRYAALLAEHLRTLREAVRAHGGVEMGTEGDALFAVFPAAADAVTAAGAAQTALGEGALRVRIGIHTGEPLRTDDGYVGIDVHRVARIAAAGHGGQVLLSRATRDLVEGDFRDLGEYRLRDIGVERIYQLGVAEFPPLQAVSRTTLPVSATAFVGRVRELREIAELLGRDGVRLLTLTGAGGSGKTRLALQAAQEVDDRYTDGVWWVPMAALTDDQLVLETVARALGARSPLTAHIASRRMLLVLDNLEQLQGATPAIARLVRACPRLAVLATSRHPLRIEGERQYRVDPLAEDEAIALFRERAASVRRDLRLGAEVAEICRRLDCLPLAVELAAARMNMLSGAALLDRLERNAPVLGSGPRDAPRRQRTLQATIEWSHDLLDDGEQRVFAALAVFAGGWTLEAAEEIGPADLDTLASLVDHSLVRPTGYRYGMLETIRKFAAQRLEASDDGTEVRARHARWFGALADQARPELLAMRARDWVDRIEAEHDNLRAALRWAIEHRDSELACRLAGGIFAFWYQRGYWSEGRRWLDAALALAPPADPARRLDPLWGASILAGIQEDNDVALARANELLVLSETHHLQRGRAAASHLLADVAANSGDMRRSLALNDHAAALAREQGDHLVLTMALNNAGNTLLYLDDLAAASKRFAESLALAREHGYLHFIAGALTNVGVTELAVGNYSRARRALREALEAASELGSVYDLYASLLLFGISVKDEPGRSTRLIGAADALLDEAGGFHEPFEGNLREHALGTARATLGNDAFAVAYAKGRALSPEGAVAEALAVR